MLNHLDLFSGIGAFVKAQTNMGITYNCVGFSEIDKYAAKAYTVIHGIPSEKNLGDITKVTGSDISERVDLITYGFPCQDISNAGKMKGFTDENGERTRSGLFFEALRLIEETKPKFAIAENVKALTGKRFKEEFKIVLDSLDEAGYVNYWKVLNAKDYGMPQNRERVFIVSIRKDIDCGFEFPEAVPLELRLLDKCDEDVDEKYYLSDGQISYFEENSKKQEAKGNGFRFRPTDGSGIAKTITTRSGSRMDDNFLKIVQVGQMYPNSGNPQAGRVYDAVGISPSLDTCQGGNRMPKIIVREATKKGYAEAYEGDSINLEQPKSKTRRGRVWKGVAQTLTTSPNQVVAVAMRGRMQDDGTVQQQLEISDREIANIITTVQKDSMVMEETLRIRKLTPTECYRLQGFTTEDATNVSEAGISNSQMYKQAGNSICVPVIEAIYRSLGERYEDFEVK